MTATYPNIHTWEADPEARILWRKTWAEPHMRLGLEVLINLGLPKALQIIVGSAGNMEQAALKQAATAGYFDFAKNIDLLKEEAKTPPGSTESAVEAWGEASLTDPAPTEPKPKRSSRKKS